MIILSLNVPLGVGGRMIIVIEGLSLTGKTTICRQLYQHYVEKGIKCKVCFHGHLYNDEIAEEYYRKAIRAYNEWDIQDAIHWSILSIQQDYCAFEQNQNKFDGIDIIFLDRHYLSQHAVAEHFAFPQVPVFERPSLYYEFLITANYFERNRRALIRNDNHSKLTDYTLSSPEIHLDFENLYKKHLLRYSTTSNQIICNDNFEAIHSLIRIIDDLLYGRKK